MKNIKTKILVTCPPMIQAKEHFLPLFDKLGWEAVIPEFNQIVSEERLCKLVKDVDGWIIGDDEATHNVVKSGKLGKLKVAVKWGVGTDNINFKAFEEFQIPITNTPGMFNDEVADIAIGYLLSLTRNIKSVDEEVRRGNWYKPQGMSIRNKTAAIVGFGNIGKNLNKKLKIFGVNTFAFDPKYGTQKKFDNITINLWPDNLEKADFIFFTCALNKNNKHMFDFETLKRVKKGVKIINVGRGPLILEEALIQGIDYDIISSAALDVFEVEPLSLKNKLTTLKNCILGSHNASNTKEAVIKTNEQAIKILKDKIIG